VRNALLFWAVLSLSSCRSSALSEKGEPAPLLTPDFGIVTKADRNRDIRSGIPFLPTLGKYLVYWQCLRLERVRMDCSGYTKYSPRMGKKTNPCIIGIDVVSDGALYEFSFDHVWDWEGFEEVRREWNELLRGHKVACFAGEYVKEERSKKNAYSRSSFWFLKRMKTRRGKWDYFKD
jgi:hypothetical protein